MKNKKYIVGIIVDNKKKVGVGIYNMGTRQMEIKSMQSVMEEFMLGKNIVGLRNKKQTVFSIKKDNYEVKDYPQLSKSYYDTNKLPIIDCEGNVIIEGSKVCVGTVGIAETKRYIIVNTKGELSFLSEMEVRKENIVGIIQCDNRINVIKDCKNVYMTMEELESEV